MDTTTLTDRLGRICMNFSSLELLVSCFVTRLISEDSKIGAIVTSEMSFQNLVKCFDSLMRYKPETTGHIGKIEGLIKRLNASEQERNKVIHSAYGTKGETADVLRLKTTAKQGKGLKYIAEPVDMDILKALTSEQLALLKEIELLYKEIYKTEIINYG